MNILVAFNDGYVMPTRVMLESLIENSREVLHIYILYIALREDSISKLSMLKGDKAILHFIHIDESRYKDVPITRFYSKEAYIRLFAQLYIPEEVDRILWLDSDVIVNGDIGEFYRQSFNDKLYVAYKDVEQGDSAEKKAELGMPADAAYINSGVLLMNLTEIRNQIQEEAITRYIKEYFDKILFVDQDVLNGLLYDCFKVLDSDYLYNYFANQITPWNKRFVYRNVRIIHYAGGCKPWNASYKHYGFHLWWKYALRIDTDYKKKYRRIYLSCIWAKIVHWAWLEARRHCPWVFNILVKRNQGME